MMNLSSAKLGSVAMSGSKRKFIGLRSAGGIESIANQYSITLLDY